MPIFDGQLSAIAAELEGCDPEECQIQVRHRQRAGRHTAPGTVTRTGALLGLSCAVDGLARRPVLVQSRIYKMRETKVIRDLNPADINKLISVSGMVTRTSGVIPDQRQAMARRH